MKPKFQNYTVEIKCRKCNKITKAQVPYSPDIPIYGPIMQWYRSIADRLWVHGCDKCKIETVHYTISINIVKEENGKQELDETNSKV